MVANIMHTPGLKSMIIPERRPCPILAEGLDIRPDGFSPRSYDPSAKSSLALLPSCSQTIFAMQCISPTEAHPSLLVAGIMQVRK